MNVGILSIGTYLPKYRIRVSEIASVWGKNPIEIERSLGVIEKTVAGMDEDAVTMAYEAASQALACSGIPPSALEVCLVGSESHPYAVNPTSTIVAEFLQIGTGYLASDLEFACKAGTTAMIAVTGLILSGKAKYGLAIGTDKAQAKPHDILEYTAASASAAVVLGKSEKAIAKILDFTSFSSDTPDFWRRDGVRFPSHGGRFTGEPAYYTHVLGSVKQLLKKTRLSPSDFDYCIFHMPNGKFPQEAAKRLGFTAKQQETSLIIKTIGNPYTASSLLGLSKVLDEAGPNKLILLVSYGSGAGSDSFIIKTTDKIIGYQKNKDSFNYFGREKKYISYIQYLKNLKKI
jgi:hydroxymethylglutaryl-CoA synthase